MFTMYINLAKTGARRNERVGLSRAGLRLEHDFSLEGCSNAGRIALSGTAHKIHYPTYGYGCMSAAECVSPASRRPRCRAGVAARGLPGEACSAVSSVYRGPVTSVITRERTPSLVGTGRLIRNEKAA